jgi:hypothetical protein
LAARAAPAAATGSASNNSDAASLIHRDVAGRQRVADGGESLDRQCRVPRITRRHRRPPSVARPNEGAGHDDGIAAARARERDDLVGVRA